MSRIPERTLSKLLRVVEVNSAEFVQAWLEHFGEISYYCWIQTIAAQQIKYDCEKGTVMSCRSFLVLWQMGFSLFLNVQVAVSQLPLDTLRYYRTTFQWVLCSERGKEERICWNVCTYTRKHFNGMPYPDCFRPAGSHRHSCDFVTDQRPVTVYNQCVSKKSWNETEAWWCNVCSFFLWK